MQANVLAAGLATTEIAQTRLNRRLITFYNAEHQAIEIPQGLGVNHVPRINIVIGEHVFDLLRIVFFTEVAQRILRQHATQLPSGRKLFGTQSERLYLSGGNEQ